MRVLHIDGGKLYGGVETLLVTLARYRDLCPDLKPEFAVCFEGRLSSELSASGAPVHMLGETRIRSPFSIWRARRRLKGLLAQQAFDAIVCHMAWPLAIFGHVVRAAEVPLVFWLHDATDGRHWLERWAARTGPDLALCNSTFTATGLMNPFSAARTETIYYPVSPAKRYDEKTREQVRVEFGVATDAVVIVQVSRLEEWKGHILLLKALGKSHHVPNWRCWIVGGAQRPHESVYLENLKMEAMQLGISDRVQFLGQRSDIPRLLAAADVFCQPNTGPEPFGIVFVEALYSGLPVVTSAIGGALEIVDENCGMLFPAGDVDELNRVLMTLVREPQLRRRLGAQGPNRARALCDPSRQLAQLRGAFERMLGVPLTAVKHSVTTLC